MEKLSFSIPSSKSKPKSKPLPLQNGEKDDRQSKKVEYVTVFDKSEPKTLNQAPPLVIPPLQNEYQPTKRLKNLHNLPSLRSSTDELNFVVESLGDVHQGDGGSNNISYGLNVRSKEDGVDQLGDGDTGGVRKTEDMLLDKLRSDLKRCAEDNRPEEYDDMPVEGYGKALLAGYGWYEGRGVGKNAKEDVKVRLYQKRSGSGSQGLGFSEESKSKSKPSSSSGIPIPAVVPSHDTNNADVNDYDRDRKRERKLKENERKRGSERDSSSDQEQIGKNVRVIGGKKKEIVGSKGVVVELLNSNWLVIKLSNSGERVKVQVVDVTDLGSEQDRMFLKKLKELKITDRETERRDISESRTSVKSERGVQWLRSHIRVRVVSKNLEGGRLYLKKGQVLDVVAPYTCTISMDESEEMVQKVDQDFLETALPRRGGSVLVLYGKHEGAFGNLVDKDLDREVGVVQDSDTHELLKVKLEQIAEVDPRSLGY